MHTSLEKKLTALQLRLAGVLQQMSEASPEEKTQQQLNRIQQLKTRIDAACSRQLERKAFVLAGAVPELHNACNSRLNAMEVRLSHAVMRLRTAGPVETIRRGYAVVMKDDVVVKDAADLSVGDRLKLYMNNGTAAATVDRVEKGS